MSKTNKNANYQAFPATIPGDEKAGWLPEYIPGITKREYFAGLALQGILSGTNDESVYYVAPRAVDMADALLLELAK